MNELRQQLIIIFEAKDIREVERIIDENAKDGPRYKSAKGQMPMVVSVTAITDDIFEALHLSKADFIMTFIGMDSEHVLSQGEISLSLFFNPHKEKKKTKTRDYKVELKNSIEKEDYEEAAIIRDIIANRKSANDLKEYRNR